MNGNRRFLVVLVVLVCAALALAWRLSYGESSPAGLIRFHVQANSNSPADQAIKYQVRDSVVRAMAGKFGQVHDVAQARRIAEENLDYMQQLAAQEVHLAGKNYPVRVEMGNFQFPEKTYHNNLYNVTLPSGKYEAVRVVLGQGAGANWWCVLFPPLCFFDPGSVEPAEKAEKNNEKNESNEEKNTGERDAGEQVSIPGGAGANDGKAGAGKGGAGNQESLDPATPAFQLKAPEALIALGSIKRNENAWIMTSGSESVEFRFKFLEAVHHSCDWLKHIVGLKTLNE